MHAFSEGEAVSRSRLQWEATPARDAMDDEERYRRTTARRARASGREREERTAVRGARPTTGSARDERTRRPRTRADNSDFEWTDDWARLRRGRERGRGPAAAAAPLAEPWERPTADDWRRLAEERSRRDAERESLAIVERSAKVRRRTGHRQPGAMTERRTVVIRGRGSERTASAVPACRRPQARAYERPGFRPDRIGMWAVLLGVLLILVAAASSHAAIRAARPMPAATQPAARAARPTALAHPPPNTLLITVRRLGVAARI